MFTPAMSASRTSPPRVIRSKASATPVRAPPFLNLLPLADEITTGRTFDRTSAVGAWARARPVAASEAAPITVLRVSRRLIGVLSNGAARDARGNHRADGTVAGPGAPFWGFSSRWFSYRLRGRFAHAQQSPRNHCPVARIRGQPVLQDRAGGSPRRDHRR